MHILTFARSLHLNLMRMMKRTGCLLLHIPQEEIVQGNKNREIAKIENGSASVPAFSVKCRVSPDYKIEIMF